MSSKFHIEGDSARLDGAYDVRFQPDPDSDIPRISVVLFLDEQNQPSDQSDWSRESVYQDFGQRWRDSRQPS